MLTVAEPEAGAVEVAPRPTKGAEPMTVEPFFRLTVPVGATPAPVAVAAEVRVLQDERDRRHFRRCSDVWSMVPA